eukprot:4821838-Pyramimonas_sp.AAC.1
MAVAACAGEEKKGKEHCITCYTPHATCSDIPFQSGKEKSPEVASAHLSADAPRGWRPGCSKNHSDQDTVRIHLPCCHGGLALAFAVVPTP